MVGIIPVLHQLGLVPAREKMSRTRVAPVEVHGVAGVELLEESAQVSARREQQQVVVVAHQHIRIHLDMMHADELFHLLQETPPVFVGAENGAPFIPARRDVVDRTRIFQS